MMRRVARILSLVLTAAGVLLLVWGGVTYKWGDPVTALYTKREQSQLRRELARREAAFQPFELQHGAAREVAVRHAQIPLKVVAQRYRHDAREGSAIATIKVPRIGLNMVVVEGTGHDTLKRGPGRDTRTFMPGEGNLVYIAGHRTTYGAPFAHIDSIRDGDRIELTLPYATVVYRVTHHAIVPADDLEQLKSHHREVLALQACHPRFSARERYIVYADPVRIIRHGAAAVQP